MIFEKGVVSFPWPYLRKWGKIDKTKGTLFSRTLKVRENKVVLLFSVLPYFLRYGRFINFLVQN